MPVSVAIGGGSDYVFLCSGEAYLENFVITDGKLLDWPPKTDLDHNGYIEITDFAEMCGHWLESGMSVQGDFQSDGTVNMRDFSIFGLAW